MLRAKLAALPHVGAFNLLNAKGWLINSSEMWPVPDASIADRRYFQEFTSGRPTPDMIVEPVVSKVTKVWTTVFARKIVGRNGEIIGFASRGVEPSHFEDFRRLAGAGQRHRDLDDPPRRHHHRPLSQGRQR